MSEKRLINVENHIIGIKSDIATLMQMMSSHIIAHKEEAQDIRNVANDHEERIVSLEGIKNKIIGASLAISTAIGLFFDSIKGLIFKS